MAHKIKVLINEEAVSEKIKEVAAQITKDYAGKQLHLICILKGGAPFMCELAKRIDNPELSMDFMSVSSYGSAHQTSGIVRIIKDLDDPIEGKNVLIVEDIIDSGYTLAHLSKLLAERQPASIEICTLLNKPSRREKQVEVKYCCFEIPDEFVVGYGLDYDQKYRNLPFIGVVEQE